MAVEIGTLRPTNHSHHSNPMMNNNLFNPNPNSNMNSSTSLSSGNFAAKFLPKGLIFSSFMPEIQMLELFLAILVFIVIHSLRQKKHQGLANWPIVGMLPSLIIGLQGDMYEWISNVICSQNGTFIFKGPWFTNLNCVVTSDPRNLEYLLKTKFSNFPKGEYFRATVKDLLGDGIFSADDEIWQKQRKTASLEFHSAKFRNLTTESLLELVHSRLLPVLEDSIKQSSHVDLQDVLLRLTTRKKELSLVSEHDKQRSDILTVFMGLKDENGQPFSDKFLRDICVNFILAGRDTSSVALSWFFWLLDKNPQVEEKIIEEICRIVSEREDDKDKESPKGLIFKPDEVKKMEYLQAALSEALRLYPSVPVDHKEVLEDDVFPDGTILKKGTKIVYAIYTMGRMEGIWGRDCRDYKPERWLRDGRFMSESAYKFTAFNGGPRLCLGKDFAYYQMKFAAASILYRYHVKVVEGHPVVPKMALTMYMKYGLQVKLFRRHESEIQKYFKIK
ncbi:hypothetical protein M9H77_09337 [Catharanthus roseus]|uniref:Uncharacterized protein n=1 Tax=Catharanthus roseus TaxID=4058 RepID=A0ACC0C0M0_CATRO|nr:hypothetical protein M9H77_09337 [Catharanthus roseus]